MTIPYLMNCSHSPDSWCLECINSLCSQTKINCTFELDEQQKVKLSKWIEEQDSLVQKDDFGQPCYGTIGGGYSFIYTPTSLGTVYEVRNNVTKEILNLTNYGDW